MIPFDDRLRALLAANLEAHPRRVTPLEGRRHAAVAVVIVDSDPGGAALLLCLRAADMRQHAGQYALPGGRLDPRETPPEAALRELHEELGMHLRPDAVIGWLDDYPTRSGYVITPVVLWGGSDPALKPARDEVLAVYHISLQALIDTEPRFISIPESDRPVLQLPLDDHLIHAPTGAVLYQLRQVGLLGRAGERVDDFEQP